MSSPLLQGAFDLHVHAAPSLFMRWGDGNELARAYRQASMAGFVLKAHHGSTVELANALRDRHADLQILGGITLNHFVGGLNPHAVEAAVALGARVVWLPTLHAAHHKPLAHHQRDTRLPPHEGLCLTGDDGELLDEVQLILDVLDGRRVVLASGHVAIDEIEALGRQLRERHLDIDLLINHVRYFVPALQIDDLDTLASERVWFELCFFSTRTATTISESATLLMKRPHFNWIIASDAGQPDSGAPPVALGGFVDGLVEAGVPADVVRQAVAHNPKQLVQWVE